MHASLVGAILAAAALLTLFGVFRWGPVRVSIKVLISTSAGRRRVLPLVAEPDDAPDRDAILPPQSKRKR